MLEIEIPIFPAWINADFNRCWRSLVVQYLLNIFISNKKYFLNYNFLVIQILVGETHEGYDIVVG